MAAWLLGCLANFLSFSVIQYGVVYGIILAMTDIFFLINPLSVFIKKVQMFTLARQRNR